MTTSTAVIFEFEFDIEEKEICIKKTCKLDCTEEEFDKVLMDNNLSEKFEDKYDIVHDFSGGGEEDGYHVGFCTYEAEENQVDGLFDEWVNELYDAGLCKDKTVKTEIIENSEND